MQKQKVLASIGKSSKLNGPFAIVVLQITRQYANFKEIYTPVIEPWLKILSNALLFEEMHDWRQNLPSSADLWPKSTFQWARPSKNAEIHGPQAVDDWDTRCFPWRQLDKELKLIPVPYSRLWDQ